MVSFARCRISSVVYYLQSSLLHRVCMVCGHIKGALVQQTLTGKHSWLSTETIKELLGISCGIWGPFVFVRSLLNTLLMCFQDAATGFSLKAEIHPNYSHFEVSSMVKTFSHGAASVTYIFITQNHPENCSQSATHSYNSLCSQCIMCTVYLWMCVYVCVHT